MLDPPGGGGASLAIRWQSTLAISALEGFSPATREWFDARLRRTDRGAGAGLAGDRLGRARADLRADRLGQDARRIPVGDRSASATAAAGLGRAASPAGARPPGISLVYVSPLKALSYDIDRNLRVPLRGIGADLTVAVRSGDTPQRERQQMLRNPPDILITTPESLYLMLTGQAQKLFEHTRWCIVDEIHAVASTKRGAHLALTLERLAEVASRGGRRPRAAADRPERDPEPARGGRALHGRAEPPVPDRRRGRAQAARPARSRCRSSRWPRPARRRGAELDPLAGGTEPTLNSIWPAMYPELLALVREHNSTIIFVNARRSAERLALRLNELSAALDSDPRAPVAPCARSRAPTTAHSRARSAPSSRSCSRPASCRAWSRPHRSSSASTWARWTS